MNAHTPGPWHYYRGGKGGVRGADDSSVCFISGPYRKKTQESEARKEANARLIAEAPNMLAALRRAVLALAFAAERSPAMQDDYEAVSAAIAAAVMPSAKDSETFDGAEA